MFGFPLVKQERNPHNYFKDHQAERIGLEHTETFCAWLREVCLRLRPYPDTLNPPLPTRDGCTCVSNPPTLPLPLPPLTGWHDRRQRLSKGSRSWLRHGVRRWP